jgi:hypothetical protein
MLLLLLRTPASGVVLTYSNTTSSSQTYTLSVPVSSGALDFGVGNTNTTRWHTVAIPNLPDSDWCFGFWTRFARTDGSQYQYVLSSGTLGATDSFHVFIGEDSTVDARKVFLRSYGTTGSEFNGGISTAPGIDTTSDRLIIVQRRGANAEIYNVLEDSTVTTPNMSLTWTTNGVAITSLRIGHRADAAANRGWRNPVSDVFMLSSSLTAAEIQQLTYGFHITALKSARQLDLRFRQDNAVESDLSGNARDTTRTGSGYALVSELFPEPVPSRQTTAGLMLYALRK